MNSERWRSYKRQRFFMGTFPAHMPAPDFSLFRPNPRFHFPQMPSPRSLPQLVARLGHALPRPPKPRSPPGAGTLNLGLLQTSDYKNSPNSFPACVSSATKSSAVLTHLLRWAKLSPEALPRKTIETEVTGAALKECELASAGCLLSVSLYPQHFHTFSIIYLHKDPSS